MSKQNQTNNPEHTPFITNVLILSDRLYDSALLLSDYMQTDTNFHIIGIAKTTNEVLSLSRNETVDFLIIAGFLDDVKSYDAIQELKATHQKFITVHWAILDKLIIYYCYKYHIEEKFDRRLPFSDFTDCLRELHRLTVFGKILGL